MKVAFDVKGTLDGRYEDKVKALLGYFQGLGAEITIWSNSYGYAYDMKNKLERESSLSEYKATTKYSFIEAEDEGRDIFDFCVEDDRGQWYLASRKTIFVDTIPDNVEEFKDLLENAPEGKDLRWK